ncbi:MFS transporter [Jiulongibacter sp. NS-SX5]|uniref:MFS transporter n=1 Tax=Jiulongibacter sp. NS-SX5 TaxID=3463854 RepID=UPI004059023F
MTTISSSTKEMTPFQWAMVLICFMLNFNDGIDVLLVSFSSTEIISFFDITKTQMGYVFSAGLLGMTLGAFFIAPLADKFGRRKIFLFAVAFIALGMLGVGFTSNFILVIVFRILTGLGIGGILPTMAATASEFSSSKFKDFSVGFVQAGWPVGAILTGILSAKYLPIYGWQAAFIVSGIIASLMWLIILFFMEDSPEFMIHHPNLYSLEKVNKVLTKMKLPKVSELPLAKPSVSVSGFKTLLSEHYKSDSIRMWAAAFFGFITLYTLMSWVPTIASDAGLPFELATFVGIALNIGAAIGSSSVGALGSKFGLKKTIFSFLLLAFVVMQVYAYSNLGFWGIFILVLLIGIFVQGGFNGIWPVLSRIYPAEIRTTGVGYTVALGRFGAITGPLIFGFMSDQNVKISFLFALFSFPLLAMGFLIKSLQSKNL